MTLFLVGLAVLLGSGTLALALNRANRAAALVGAGGAIAGSLLAIYPSGAALLSGIGETARTTWAMPFGSLTVGLDPLSALFLIPILALTALAALYGWGYLKHDASGRAGSTWFCYNLLAVSMAGVVIARNALLFLVAWEIMSLSSFFLVAVESEKPNVRRAAWTYLIATHLGTAFVLTFFLVMAGKTGSLEFDSFASAAFPPVTAGMLFVFALIGFGTKAGFIPLHVWLPEAHPAAPSHVSALMSGVMIKTGIYGIVRTLTFLGAPPAWWGWALIAIGLSSGVMGVLFALAQHDLKRLLAYHSVENIGIIALGLGLGVMGMRTGSPLPVVLGFGGALLHVVNHALFKGLLFLGAGSVQHATGSREMERLGGLLKRMPVTGACFLIGAVAICGIPPLNGFVSEFAIYWAGYVHASVSGPVSPWAGVAVIAGLALIGGLALACFTKAFGIVFLGEPRSEEAARGHESGIAMTLPMMLLAAACLGIGLLAPAALTALVPALSELSGMEESRIVPVVEEAAGPLRHAVTAFAILFGAIALLALLRKALLAGRRVTKGVTWDCGYAQPTSRMQYTASSFAQPLLDLFARAVGVRRRLTPPAGLLPSNAASFHSEGADTFLSQLFVPLFNGIGAALKRVRPLQHGRLHLYVLYLALTLLILLIWHLGGGR